ncbi:aspartate-semialdehyde dehydrogenase [Helicobacter sp. 16-1353]|uniref:aspartate-semialdehyde dehydrogenase n=1 Tax=Helicobacter sp. 16-1353 TaxID=2004996 RepID=UPI000DCF2967|nr:aspartate-semialdehyde dehydrogenase [Helicobacter sp. 16-1353]RAX52729.1 aspartate-semialdehyde dehydrogenase [Helicobacter sp. 16-1353]
MKEFIVAIVGASGAVGEEIISILEEQNFPIKKLIPLASKRSVGKEIIFKGDRIPIQETTHTIFKDENIEIAFFSAGGSVSSEFVPSATDSGALVIDNTSHFRMHENVPLVVPEVNPDDIKLWKNSGIIANPNCSTIQMVQVLSPLHKQFNIKRVDVSTYQAVSGAGKKGMESLINETKDFINGDEKAKIGVFPHKIAFNLIPQIDIFLDNSYTKEEMKMIKETSKIMHSNFEISATCVRVPVLRSHSEAISIRFDKKVSPNEIREVLNNAENIIVIDDINHSKYPMPSLATMSDNTFVGRIRSDYFDKNTIHLFCVADQIRVGAATNAVRIAKKWLDIGLK